MAEGSIFVSLSHRDERWLHELQNHLGPYLRNRSLAVWDDTEIAPGTKWKDEIEQVLNAATVAILLVSPNYLASDFIANEELAPLLQAAETRGLPIGWIAVSTSAYKETLIAQYQAVNDPAMPLDRLAKPQRNREWIRIGEWVNGLIEPRGAAGGRIAKASSLDDSSSAMYPASPIHKAEGYASPPTRTGPYIPQDEEESEESD